jgi:hypothetical protein
VSNARADHSKIAQRPIIVAAPEAREGRAASVMALG